MHIPPCLHTAVHLWSRLGHRGWALLPISYTWTCCQEMPLTSNQNSLMSLETHETAVMAVLPNPGAPSLGVSYS